MTINMKKINVLILCLGMVLVFTSCNSKSEKGSSSEIQKSESLTEPFEGKSEEGIDDEIILEEEEMTGKCSLDEKKDCN